MGIIYLIMVIVRRDGGGRLDAAREAPRLGVRVWSTEKQEANDLARLVAALLWASPDGDPVAKVTITGGPYAVPDDSGQELRYITAELITKGRDDACQARSRTPSATWAAPS